MSIKLFLPSQCLFNGPTNEVAIVTEMENMQRLNCQCYCWVPNLPTAETNTESLIWKHSSGGLFSHLVADYLHWTFSIMEKDYICPHWNRHIFWK